MLKIVAVQLSQLNTVSTLQASHLIICRFIVPQDKTEEFEATWREREANMQQLPGFLGFSLDKQQGSDYVVISK